MIPPDEPQRLAALQRYAILDTPTDAALDRVTALAARLLNTPIALVSLVDSKRIWFKSRYGWEVQQIGRDPGLCASAILQDDAYTVLDAQLDPRTRTHPLVTGEFGLRFYAAAPLRTNDGYNLGTLCVIDFQPRQISPAEKQLLVDLAATVMDMLNCRLTVTRLEQREIELKQQALAANRAKHHSLARINDDICPPLHGVMGLVERLLTTDLTSQQRSVAETIRSSSETLLTMLSAILDVSSSQGSAWLETALPPPYPPQIDMSFYEVDPPNCTACPPRWSDRAATLRILVAEHHQVNQQVTLQLLQHLGYQADLVSEGLAALDALRQGAYDLVLLNVQLPDLDGLTVARRIRQAWPKADRPRLIAMSAKGLPKDRQACFAAEIDDHISHPIQIQELTRVLGHYRSAGQPVSGSLASAPSPQAPQIPTLDPDVLKNYCKILNQNPATIVTQLIECYLEDASRYLELLKNAADCGDMAAFEQSTHSLKGASAAIGAARLVQLCKELEGLIRVGKLPSAVEQVARLEAEYGHVTTALLEQHWT